MASQDQADDARNNSARRKRTVNSPWAVSASAAAMTAADSATNAQDALDVPGQRASLTQPGVFASFMSFPSSTTLYEAKRRDRASRSCPVAESVLVRHRVGDLLAPADRPGGERNLALGHAAAIRLAERVSDALAATRDHRQFFRGNLTHCLSC